MGDRKNKKAIQPSALAEDIWGGETAQDVSAASIPETSIAADIWDEETTASPLASADTDIPKPEPAATTQEYTNKLFGKDVQGRPIVSATPPAATPVIKADPQERLRKATESIATDYISVKGAPEGIDINNPQNPINQVTSPTADPAYIGSYIQGRMSDMDADYRRRQHEIQSREMSGAPVFGERQQAKKEYEEKKKALFENAGHIVSLQLFNKEYGQQKPSAIHSDIAMDARLRQHQSEIQDIDDQIKATKTWAHPNGIEAVQERRSLGRKKELLQETLQSDAAKIKQNQKFNPILLGAEYHAAFGDKEAIRDIELIRQGKAVNPARQYAYNQVGNTIIEEGTAAAVNENAISEGAANIDVGGERLFENNKPFILEQARMAVANKKYQKENALLHAIVPSAMLPDISKEEIKAIGEEAGLSEKVIKEIQADPSLIPKSTSLMQQFARGALNTAAPIYEQGIRALARLSPDGDMEFVEEHFQPGWESQRGLGAAIAGNNPTEQNSFRNFRGAVGQIMEGAGGLATFAGEVGIVGRELAKLGVAASQADKLANFSVMAFNGYNDAYHTSKEVIGEDPKDEGKRQLYSLINGIAAGAIFSISPQAELVKKALGMETKGGKKLLEEIQKNKGIEFLSTKQGKATITDYVREFLKENGKQVGLATTVKIAEQITNAIANPEMKQDVAEDIKNTAISTALAMFLPSIGGAFGHVRGKTPLNSAAAFEVGTHPEEYINHVSDLLAEGKISPADAQVSHDAILNMKKAVSATPTKNADGKDLSPNQIKDYAYSLLQESIIQKQADKITESAKALNITPDKAQVDPLKERISALQQERLQIMENPQEPTVEVAEDVVVDGEGDVVADTEVVVEGEENQGENRERSVATDAVSEEIAPTEKKSSEKVAEIEKEDIPLTSTEAPTTEIATENVIVEPPKNSENGSIKENVGRQDGSEIGETERSRESAEVRQAADSEGRIQLEETGQLKKGKKPRKRIKLEPEQPEVVAQAIPFVEPPKAEKDATENSKREEQVSNKQSGEAERTRTEPSASEESTPQAGGGDSVKRIKKKPKKEVETTPVATLPTKPKRKGKVWNPTEYMNRRKAVLKEEASSIEEHLAQVMLGMDDKNPTGKWRYSDVEKELPSRNVVGNKQESGDPFAPRREVIPEEKRIAKQFAHKDGKPIDQWADDLAREIEDGHHPFSLGRMDSKGIADLIKSMVSRFPSKHALLEHLENLREGRKEKDPTDLSEADYIASRQLIEQRERMKKEWEDEDAAKIEEQIHQEIAETKDKLSQEDVDILDSYLQKFVKDGIYDDSGIDVFSEEFQSTFHSLSPEGKKIFDTIIEGGSGKNTDLVKEIITKADQNRKKYEADDEQQQASAEADSRDAAEGQGGDTFTRDGDVADVKAPESGKETGGKAGEPAVEKESPETILSRKKKRHEELSLELDELKGDRENLEAQLESAYATSTPDAEFIDRVEQAIREVSAAIEAKERKVKLKQREIDIQKAVVKNAAAIRKQAKKIEDSSRGMIGVMPGVSPKIAAEILRKVADLYEGLGNVYVAAIRAAEWARQQFKGEKGIGALSDVEVRELLSAYTEPQHTEPIIKNKQHLESAREAIEDIINGEATLEQIIEEVMDNADVSDKTKANILNYIDWHIQGRDYHNDISLREKEYEDSYYDEYAMTGTGRETNYLSEQTLKDVTGQDVLEREKAEALSIQNISRDAANLTGLAKNKYGDDIMQWGAGMLEDVRRSKSEDPVKKVAALTGLAWELRAEKQRNPSRELQVDKMLVQVEKMWKETLRTASKTMNAARANRLFRNEHYADMYAEQIMNDAQREGKRTYEDVLGDQKRMDEVSEKYEKEGVLRNEAEVAKEEAIKAEKAKKREEQKAKEEAKKSPIEKIRDVFRKSKKDTREAKSKEYYREQAEKTAKEMGKSPDKFMDELKAKIKAIKC